MGPERIGPVEEIGMAEHAWESKKTRTDRFVAVKKMEGFEDTAMPAIAGFEE